MNPNLIILLWGVLSGHLPQGNPWMSRQIVHTLDIHKTRIGKQAPDSLALIVAMFNE